MKGSKKVNGGQKKNKAMNVNKPQSGDARKEKNINDIVDDAELSWSLEEEVPDSSIDRNVSEQDKSTFFAARTHVATWVDSVRTPVEAPSAMNPLPHPMQHVVSNISNTSIPVNWRDSLFNNIIDEGLNLEQHAIARIS